MSNTEIYEQGMQTDLADPLEDLNKLTGLLM